MHITGPGQGVTAYGLQYFTPPYFPTMARESAAILTLTSREYLPNDEC
jgi:hypothetical protein